MPKIVYSDKEPTPPKPKQEDVLLKSINILINRLQQYSDNLQRGENISRETLRAITNAIEKIITRRLDIEVKQPVKRSPVLQTTINEIEDGKYVAITKEIP